MYVDVTDLLAFRKKVNAETGAGLTVNDFIVKAVSIALQRTPLMNSAFNEDMTQIQVYGNYNISVMTASDKGLVAPVIKETEKKTIYQISAEMKEMIEKANAGKLMPDDYAGGTFGVTIVNLGPGHSYGMLGMLVELESGNYLLAADAIYSRAHYEPVPQLSGVVYDEKGYFDTMEFLRRYAAEHHAELLFGHDMKQFQSLKKSTEGYYQ